MPKTETYIDRAFAYAKRTGKPVTIISTNGHQMHSTVTHFDDESVVLRGKDIDPERKQHFYFRHAISTVILPEEIKMEEGE